MKKFLKKKKSLFLLDEKGQAGTVFRLMVDAIVGLVILALIVSTLNYFYNLRVEVSKAEFRDKVSSAVSSPNGKVIESDSLIFSEGEGYTSQQIQSFTSIPAGCFKFISNRSFVEVDSSCSLVEFKRNVEAKIYVKCWPNEEALFAPCEQGATDCCEMYCIISFGEKLVVGEEDFGC